VNLRSAAIWKRLLQEELVEPGRFYEQPCRTCIEIIVSFMFLSIIYLVLQSPIDIKHAKIYESSNNSNPGQDCQTDNNFFTNLHLLTDQFAICTVKVKG
jgi:hypothetical protein